MARATLRILVLAAVLAVLGTPTAYGLGRADAQNATPGTDPAAMPATPVGDQLAWVLAQLNGGAASLTEAELAAHVAPGFLAAFPVPLLGLLRETAAQYAPIVVTGLPFPPTATGAVAEVDLATGEHAAIYLAVEAAPPHRIARLDLGEAPAPATPTGRRVDIGGRALSLDCVGSGGPTVVLEGGVAADWAAVRADLAASVRVCAYDRPDSPGGRSDPTPQRTAGEVVDDLRMLLTAAGEPGPYVLVGHSMGGLYVQLYAYRHPGEVAGLVLVDPTPEEFGARLGALAASLGTPVPVAPSEPGPDEVGFAQMREARAPGPPPPVPLVVLSHGNPGDPSERPPGWPIAEEERIWRGLHAGIARLAPGGRHVVVEGSGHDIHQERPDIVVRAILDVVAAAREPSSWATPAAGTPAP